MTTATTALRDAADTIRDAAETGLHSIGGLLEDAKHRVDAVHVPKVSISKQRKRRGWMGWFVLVGVSVVAALILKNRSSSATPTTNTMPASASRKPEPAAA